MPSSVTRHATAFASVLVLSAGLLPAPLSWHALLMALWIGLSFCIATPQNRHASWIGWGVTSLLALVSWTIHPGLWVLAACTWLTALPFTQTSESERLAFGPLATAVALGVPAAGTAGLLYLGGPGANALSMELLDAAPRTGTETAKLGVTLTAGALGFAIVSGPTTGPDPNKASRAQLWLAWFGTVGMLALLVARGSWMLSTISWPHELQWSEAPLLLNLLKLELGVPIYGPPEDCNSYSYSPLLELVHTGLLGPLGHNLSLTANRLVLLVWHLFTVLTLGWALAPFARGLWRDQNLPGALRVAAMTGFGCALALAVTSSFLAPVLHPDHLMMMAFAAAIALVLGERRLPRGLFVLGLVVVPVFATSAKLTGAGIGLGLVLAHAWPWRPRELAWLCVSALLALTTIPVFDATLGQFSTYAIELQASHPLRWHLWLAPLHTGAGRALLTAAAMVLAAWSLMRTTVCDDASERTHRNPWLRDSLRLALLTLGFSLTSSLAYLKVGGRENSLLPWVIGATAVGIRACPLLGGYRALFAPTALCVLLLAAPPKLPQTNDERARAASNARELAALAKREQQQGRHTLLHGSTAAWLEVAPERIPLDRPQSVYELELANHPALDAFWQRLESGHYGSVVIGSHLLAGSGSLPSSLERRLEAHFRLVSPPHRPTDGVSTPLLFRFRPETAAGAQSAKRHAR